MATSHTVCRHMLHYLSLPHLQRLRTLNLADADDLVAFLNILEPVDRHSAFTSLSSLVDFLLQVAERFQGTYDSVLQ